MTNSNILNITMNLTGWPAAVTCGVGIVVIGGATVYIASKLIDNGYQLKNDKGLSLVSSNREPSVQPDASCVGSVLQPFAA